MAVGGVDAEIRAAAFQWLEDQVARYGERIPWKVLQSFTYDGRRIALITQRGIRWQRGMPALSFATTYSSDPSRAPYADHVGDDGLPRYKYQGTDAASADNVAMKRAEASGLPLTKAHYVERLTRMRLHQPLFRSRVLRAYQTTCAICRLRHASLLDAAHIVTDAAGGQPVVTNGLALCKIHHAAYDQYLLSVTPTYRVAIAPSVLRERDGPMLLHGLQEAHGWSIQLPRRRAEHPDRDALAERHATFAQLG